MADVNANIGVGIDTSDALAQLKNLQRQISQFHQSVAKSSATAAASQRDLQKNFLNSINAIQGFSAEMRTVKTTAESFTTSLEKNKLSIKEYFRYAAGATRTFGKSFQSEFDTIEKTAIERVKSLQTQYIKMGRDANGAMRAIAIRPTTLDMEDLGTQSQITAQKQALFNQLIRQGSTQLLNFGKNTQWAGRQLMVGFTLPLASFGMIASKSFMEMETAALKFKKVYGDLFTSQADTQAALDGITELAKAYTQYGVAVADTVALAAEAAAAGYKGVDLQNQTAAATKLSVLGQIEGNQALETTIALQNAFKTSSTELATQIDFLNAVENQTVVSLDDITTAIPKVAPVIQQLGGDVKDLAFFMAAMKEGGINASEGANALKSGLGSLINPTKKASDMLMGYGINVNNIVSRNQGDLKATVVEFARALDQLNPLERSRAIEQMFGKFQFARLSTLFQNVSKDGTQAARVLELAGSSVSDLAALSDKELGQTGASSMMKFKKAIEDLQLALAPVGKMFLEIATPFVEFGKGILEAFNRLPDGIQKAIGTIIAVVGGLGPILLMTFGLVNNGIANMIKFFMTVRTGYLKITGQASKVAEETQYMTTEQLDAAAAAASLDQAHSKLTQRFTAEKVAVDSLKTAYQQAAAAGDRFALMNPGMMQSGKKQMPKFANGGFIVGPGSGKSDSIGAMVSNGEAIIPADKAKKYAPLVSAIITGKVPGFVDGTEGVGKKSTTIGTVLGGTFPGKQYSPAAMMAPGNTPGGFGMDKEWLQFSEGAKASFAASLKTIMMLGDGIKVSQTGYSKFWVGMEPVLDEIFNTFKTGITDDVTSIAQVGQTQYPLMIENIQKLQREGKITADEAEKLAVAVRKLVAPLESDLTQNNIQRVELGLNDAGDAFVKRAATERQGETYKPQIKRATAVELKQRGLPEMGEGYSYAHIPESAPKQTYIEPSLRKKAGAGSILEQETMKRLAAGEILKEGTLIAKKVGEDLVAVGAQTTSEGSKGYVRGAKEEAQTASPSKVTEQIGRDVVAGQVIALKDGVDDVKVASAEIADAVVAPITQASKEAKAKPTFGTPSQVPVAAVGNAPKMIGPAPAPVQRTLAGDIKASIANFKPNMAQMATDIKSEWASLGQQIKALFKRSGQETLDVVEAYNNQLVINGKEAGYNFVAAYQGRDGAIEAVLTKKNAEIISGITQSWNAGSRDIPLLISDGVKDQKQIFDFAGGAIANQIAKSSIERAKALEASVPTKVAKPFAGPSAGQKGFVGPLPEGMERPLKKTFSETMSTVSKFSMGLSAVSGVMSMFGGQLGEFSGVIMGITGGLFALIQITELLAKTKLAEVVASRASAVASKMGALGDASGGVMQFVGTLFKGGKGITGILTAVSTGFRFLLNFLGPIGIAISVLSIAVPLFADAIQKQKDKIEGLGNAAFLTGEKLKTMAGIAGFAPTRDPGAVGTQTAGIKGVESGIQTSEIDKIRASEDFKSAITDDTKFKKEFEALKGASLEEAQAAINSMMTEMIALAPEGTDPKAIQNFAAALAAEAGKSGISVDVAVKINPYTKEGNEQAIKNVQAQMDSFKTSYATMIADQDAQHGEELSGGFKIAADAVANSASASFEVLKTGLQSGTLSVEEYNAAARRLMDTMLTGSRDVNESVLNTMFENLGVKPEIVAGIDDLTSRIKILKALQAGANISEEEIKIVDKGDDPFASAEDKKKAADMIIEIDKRRVKAAVDTAAALKAAKEAEAKATAETDLSAIQAEIDGNEAKLAQADELVAAGLSEADAIKAVTDAKWQNIFAQAKLDDAGTGKTKNMDAAISSYNALAASTNKLTDAQNAANYEEWKKGIQGQSAALKGLKKDGVPTADAIKLVGDASALAAYKIAAAKGKGKEWLAEWKNLQKEAEKLSTTSSNAGTPKEDPFKESMKSLKQSRLEITYTSQSYMTLTKKGMDAAKALKIAQDPQLLSAMAAGVKYGSKKWKELVAEIEKGTAALTRFDKIRIFQEGIAALKKQKEEITNTSTAFTQLTASGMNAEDAIAIATNPQLLAAMATGIKAGSDQWNLMVDNIKAVTAASKELEAQQKKIKDATTQGKTDLFNDVYSKVQAIFSANEAALDAAHAANTKADNALINTLQDQIEGYNRQIGALEHNLDAIQEKEDAINKAYDEKVSALEKVKKVNDEILRQTKDQLSIADALSSGDVSAAARAVQEARAGNAEAALSNQGDMLQAARDKQISGVTEGGKTRSQIEAEVKGIKAQIYTIETGTLRAAQDRVKAAGEQLVKDKEALTVQGLTKTEWLNKKIEIDKAESSAKLYEKDTLDALGNVKAIVAEWAKVPGTVKTNVVVTYTTVGTPPAGVSGVPDSGTKVGTYAQGVAKYGNLGATVLKGMGYYADGGFIPKGSDTVPAMLTPGEFVMNTSAVERFGPLLSAINSGISPSLRHDMSAMSNPTFSTIHDYTGKGKTSQISAQVDNSVYNYNLSVNVEGSNSSAADIANVVINKLRNIESQKVRGQVIR